MSHPSDQASAPGISRSSTDRELWDAVRRDEERAWDILVRRYETLVYTIATRAGLSQAEAADCFQQTWVQLYSHRRKIDSPDRISAWLTTTAKREALRMRKRARRFVELDSSQPLMDSAPLPDEELWALERRARLESALERLDARCRELLTALFLAPDAKSYDQIATDLGLPKNSLGPSRSRCLAKLSKLVKAEGWN
jgi:RNA polymerase sigma factor (sigma-70 family)